MGSLLVLGSAISYAAYLPMSSELVKRVGSMRLVSCAMCVSSLAYILQFFILRPASMLIQPMQVYGLSIINAFFCTVLPVFLTMAAAHRATTTSQAGMIGPVSILFLAALILDEPINGVQIAGTALVICGIYL